MSTLYGSFAAYTPLDGSADWPAEPGFSGDVSFAGSAALEVTVPAVHRMFVLARRSEFTPAAGTPTAWKPGTNYGYGTAGLSREIGIGELLSYKRSKSAEWAAVVNQCGANLFGGVGDEMEVVDATCMVSLVDAADEPDTGDEFTVEGRTFTLVSYTVLNEAGEERHAQLRGVRALGLTKKVTREAMPEVPTVSNA